MKLLINSEKSLITCIDAILDYAKGRSDEIVEKQLIWAILRKLFKGKSVLIHSFSSEDRRIDLGDDFFISKLVYHIASAPSRDVLHRCANNINLGLLPTLLVPKEQINRVQVLAQDEGIDKYMIIMSIENFVALHIIQFAAEEKKDVFSVMNEIIEIYNKRLAEVETDISLRIDIK
ncbi:MAG: DUF4928 family protein [Anaerolineales bacterium]|nr:DUF4928 family protein [Anaerolineales bacterium]